MKTFQKFLLYVILFISLQTVLLAQPNFIKVQNLSAREYDAQLLKTYLGTESKAAYELIDKAPVEARDLITAVHELQKAQQKLKSYEDKIVTFIDTQSAMTYESGKKSLLEKVSRNQKNLLAKSQNFQLKLQKSGIGSRLMLFKSAQSTKALSASRPGVFRSISKTGKRNLAFVMVGVGVLLLDAGDALASIDELPDADEELSQLLAETEQ